MAIFIYISTQIIFEKHTQRTKTAVTTKQVFPDVSDEEEKVCGRPFLLLMLHIRNLGMCHRGQCGAGGGFPDLSDEEGKVYRRAILLLKCHIGKRKCIRGGFCS